MIPVQNFKKLSEFYFDKVLQVRRHLHANPELSFNEINTSAYIIKTLNDAGIKSEKFAGTGVVAGGSAAIAVIGIVIRSVAPRSKGRTSKRKIFIPSSPRQPAVEPLLT